MLGLMLSILLATAPGDEKISIGLNLGGGTTYWDGQVFSDLIRQANAPTGGTAAGNKAAVQFRPDGWPESVDPAKQAVPAMLMASGSPLPPGFYTLSAEGVGELQLSFTGYPVRQSYTFKGGGESHRIPVPKGKAAADSVVLLIRRSDKADPIRNVKLLTPNASSTHPFRPEFLDDIRGAKIVRVMDWRYTNTFANDVRTWDDYLATTRKMTNQGGGVRLEDCAAAASAIDADLWFCIPYNADDDCIRRMAKLLDSSLKPGLSLYVEYSNELWNLRFKQAIAVKEEAEKFTPKKTWWYWAGEKTGRKLATFKDALKDSPNQRKVVRVVSGQALGGGIGGATQTAQGAAQTGGYEALAFAPYFGWELKKDAARPIALRFNEAQKAIDEAKADGKKSKAELQSITRASERAKDESVEEVFTLLNQYMTDAWPQVLKWRDLAAKQGVPLLTYEDGQHLVAFPHGESKHPDALTALYQAVNDDPRMEQAYLRHINELQSIGVRTTVLFNSHTHPTQYGTWGLKNWVGQPEYDAPKYRAVKAFLGGK